MQLVLPLPLPLFHYSTIALFRFLLFHSSTLPPFQYPTILFHSSTIPVHYPIIPIFHNSIFSILPLLHYSTSPLFHYSTQPLFHSHYSHHFTTTNTTLPLFQYHYCLQDNNADVATSRTSGTLLGTTRRPLACTYSLLLVALVPTPQCWDLQRGSGGLPSVRKLTTAFRREATAIH